MTQKQVQLPVRHLLPYAIPAFPTSVLFIPVYMIIPAFYAKYTTTSLAAIGTILLVSRLFDAVTDPLIGYFSDRTTSRIGSRKPWMIAGTLIAMVCVYFMFNPPAASGTVYFAVWSLLLWLAWTMIMIPYDAWATEISRHYDDRTRIMTYRSVLGSLGGMLFLAAPLFPMFETTEYSPEMIRWTGWAVIISLPLFISIAMIWAPIGEKVVSAKSDFRGLWRSVKSNKLLWRFITISLIQGMAAGIGASVVFLFTDNYLGLGDKFPHLAMVSYILGFATLPLWLKLMVRYGKHRTWAFGIVTSTVISLGYFFVQPGPGAFVPALVMTCSTTILAGTVQIAPGAMFADIIDLDLLRTGSNRAGNYIALLSLLSKANMAIGGAVGFWILAAVGFNAQADQNTDMANLGMLVTYILVPGILYLISASLLRNYPLDGRRHAIIRKRLEQRAERAARDAEAVSTQAEPSRNGEDAA